MNEIPNYDDFKSNSNSHLPPGGGLRANGLATNRSRPTTFAATPRLGDHGGSRLGNSSTPC